MKDNFSAQANSYAKFRPSYPLQLYQFIYSHLNAFNTAWDCATGNGQTAVVLADTFKKVYATDISEKQLKEAPEVDNIFYSIQSAEHTNFSNSSMDLITVSQALHWFDFDSFYEEVKRVLRPNGVFAAWTYPLFQIGAGADEIVQHFYADLLGTYWDDERKYIDELYATIPFPLKEIKAPVFKIDLQWTIDDLGGFLNTWSALQKYVRQNGENPVNEVLDKLKPYWKTDKMHITFPLHLRLGKL